MMNMFHFVVALLVTTVCFVNTAVINFNGDESDSEETRTEQNHFSFLPGLNKETLLSLMNVLRVQPTQILGNFDRSKSLFEMIFGSLSETLNNFGNGGIGMIGENVLSLDNLLNNKVVVIQKGTQAAERLSTEAMVKLLLQFLMHSLSSSVQRFGLSTIAIQDAISKHVNEESENKEFSILKTRKFDFHQDSSESSGFSRDESSSSSASEDYAARKKFQPHYKMQYRKFVVKPKKEEQNKRVFFHKIVNKVVHKIERVVERMINKIFNASKTDIKQLEQPANVTFVGADLMLAKDVTIQSPTKTQFISTETTNVLLGVTISPSEERKFTIDRTLAPTDGLKQRAFLSSLSHLDGFGPVEMEHVGALQSVGSLEPISIGTRYHRYAYDYADYGDYRGIPNYAIPGLYSEENINELIGELQLTNALNGVVKVLSGVLRVVGLDNVLKAGQYGLLASRSLHPTLENATLQDAVRLDEIMKQVKLVIAKDYKGTIVKKLKHSETLLRKLIAAWLRVYVLFSYQNVSTPILGDNFIDNGKQNVKKEFENTEVEVTELVMDQFKRAFHTLITSSLATYAVPSVGTLIITSTITEKSTQVVEDNFDKLILDMENIVKLFSEYINNKRVTNEELKSLQEFIAGFFTDELNILLNLESIAFEEDKLTEEDNSLYIASDEEETKQKNKKKGKKASKKGKKQRDEDEEITGGADVISAEEDELLKKHHEIEYQRLIAVFNRILIAAQSFLRGLVLSGNQHGKHRKNPRELKHMLQNIKNLRAMNDRDSLPQWIHDSTAETLSLWVKLLAREAKERLKEDDNKEKLQQRHNVYNTDDKPSHYHHYHHLTKWIDTSWQCPSAFPQIMSHNGSRCHDDSNCHGNQKCCQAIDIKDIGTIFNFCLNQPDISGKIKFVH